MTIDLHVHSKNSDGKFSVEEIVAEAKIRKIDLLSITDHDSIICQTQAYSLAKEKGIKYVCGVELNVTFSHPRFREGKPIALDFLGYQFNPENKALKSKLALVSRFRHERATKILENLNLEFDREGVKRLAKADFDAIEASVDGVLGRPHIADYLVMKHFVKTRQEAFDKYLVKCDVPKFPIYLDEASSIVRGAGGKLVLAHPNDPNGTSLVGLTRSLPEQTSVIADSMLKYIDGIECWHSRQDAQTVQHYVKFAQEHELMITGGSDCHQKPVLLGTVQVPSWVSNQFAH